MCTDGTRGRQFYAAIPFLIKGALMSKTAIVTMVYNEADILPLWRKYYVNQFSANCCYVVDHGSTDGSTRGLDDINVIQIPRSPMDDKKRARFLSSFCSALLEWYDTVIYTDVDEFLVPDPERYESLAAFCAENKRPVISAVGLNILHVPDIEGALDFNRNILHQRRFVRFAFAMCKPILTKVPINWTPGFHSCDHGSEFDGLFMFHTHNVDFGWTIARLAKTRAMQWVDQSAGAHQRMPDEQYLAMLKSQAGLPKVKSSFREDDPNILRHLLWIKTFIRDNPDKRHGFYAEGPSINELLEIPDRFQDAF